MVVARRLHLNPKRSCLLLGPRRVGKTTFLHTACSDATFIDLLKSDVFFEYHAHPSLLREQFGTGSGTVVLDEVQRVPELVHEVHWLIENTRRRFVLCGSSARKLRRHGITNLAGRLSGARMFPLSWVEVPDFDLPRRLQYGCLPPVMFSDDPAQDLRDYCGEYLREEIQAEGIVRNLPAFSRFLEQAALRTVSSFRTPPSLANAASAPKPCRSTSRSSTTRCSVFDCRRGREPCGGEQF